MIFKSDKLDYLQCPRKEFFFDNLFSIGLGPSNAWKLNWNLLGFFSFIFILAQCDISRRYLIKMEGIKKMLIKKLFHPIVRQFAQMSHDLVRLSLFE